MDVAVATDRKQDSLGSLGKSEEAGETIQGLPRRRITNKYATCWGLELQAFHLSKYKTEGRQDAAL